VFLAADTPESFSDLVQGRCLCLHPHDVDEIVRVATAAADRYAHMRNSNISEVELQWVDADTPTLLLVDDEPVLLSTMVRLLRDVGLDVIPADSGNHAISVLQNQPEVHVVLSDWYMFDGNGYDLYAWIQEHRPELAPSCIFMSAGSPEEFGKLATGRTLVPKGQDSPYLISQIIAAARRTKSVLDGG
jgi:CheY-like chemotaxis protein